MEICPANSSLETAIEVLAFSVDSASFELNQLAMNEESNELEDSEINPFNLRFVSSIINFSYLLEGSTLWQYPLKTKNTATKKAALSKFAL